MNTPPQSEVSTEYVGSYTGIGSRETPPEILEVMVELATRLNGAGWLLRSGGANGADRAFEAGAGPNKRIYTPWEGFSGKPLLFPVTEEALSIASQHHPRWQKLSQGAKLLMGRNVYQVLSETLSHPSRFVVCWTPDGCTHYSTRSEQTGGTGMAISLASHHGIEVFNLKLVEHLDRVKRFLDKA